MKNYLLRIAPQLNVPITIWRVLGWVIFWRSTDEDMQLAQEVGKRRQEMRQQRSRA
jgi:hypothetical protein